MKKIFTMLHGVEIFGPWSQAVMLVLVIPPALIVSAISQRMLEVRVTNYLRARFGGAKHK